MGVSVVVAEGAEGVEAVVGRIKMVVVEGSVVEGSAVVGGVVGTAVTKFTDLRQNYSMSPSLHV